MKSGIEIRKYGQSRWLGHTVIIAFLIMIGVVIWVDYFNTARRENSLESTEVISIAISNSPLSAPLIIAFKEGFFSDQGLKVKIVPVEAGYIGLGQLIVGDVQLATVTDVPIALNSVASSQYAVIATMAQTYKGEQVIVTKDSAIKSVSDLRGKRIATVTGTSSHYYLYELLNKYHVPPSTVDIIHVNAGEAAQALANNNFDGLVIWEPYASEALAALGDKVMGFEREEVYRKTFNIVINRSFYDANPEASKHILRAADKAIRFIKERPKLAIGIVAKYLNQSEESIAANWELYSFRLFLDREFIDTLRKEAVWATENYLFQEKEIPNYRSYINEVPLSREFPDRVNLD